MPIPNPHDLLEPILDFWDRNNRILVNLLHALPPGTLQLRAMDSSPSIAEMFTHIHYVRLVFLTEDTPDLALPLPSCEWISETDTDRIAAQLDESATAVRQAVADRIRSGRPMDRNYDHPLLFLQHMIFHEGYHHGQIKLVLKLAGKALNDEIIGPQSWGIFIDKTISVQPESPHANRNS